MATRYFISLSYNGTRYCGWQVQPNGISVQEELSRCISTILREEIAITGAGRTDAGVHAKKMIAHFDCQKVIVDTHRFLQSLNSFLPPDIAVYKIVEVSQDYHARFSATSRSYEYHVVLHKNPFKQHQAWKLHFTPNFEAMNEAAKSLFTYTDFTSFSKLHTDVKTNNCKVSRAEWLQEGDEWVFHITADRFLRNMVRAIVGTLMMVGKGEITIDEFCNIIEAKDRCKAGQSVPADGLYLVNVTYPNLDF